MKNTDETEDKTMLEFVIQLLIFFFLLGIILIPLSYLHRIWWSKWGWKYWGFPRLDRTWSKKSKYHIVNFDDYKEK